MKSSLSIHSQDKILLQHKNKVLKIVIQLWDFGGTEWHSLYLNGIKSHFGTFPKYEEKSSGTQIGVKVHHSTQQWPETHSRDNAKALKI